MMVFSAAIGYNRLVPVAALERPLALRQAECQSMAHSIEIRQSYKYRMYQSADDHYLHDQINIAGIIWNHVTALQKRYYRRFGGHIGESRLKQHIAFLRMKT